MKIVPVTFLLAVLFGILLQGCAEKSKPVNTISPKEQMLKADEAFSELSRQQGMKKAFIEFIDDDGILLRPNQMPIIGADAIEFISQANDSTYTLTWKPSGGEISSSGDLGFTYGIYSLRMPDTILSGTYVNIWKRLAEGKWKFILDSGNEGLQADTAL